MKLKSARVLSFSILLGLSGAAAAGDITLGEGPYPPEPEVASVTSRAQVLFELRQAQRLDQLSIGEADSDSGVPQSASIKSRSQVVAELREAQRLGLTGPDGEGDITIATAAEERLIVEAGLRAREQSRVAAG